MNDLERDLYWEMARTIKLLGGKEDILGVLDIMNSEMPQAETIQEIIRLVKCWNDNIEKQMDVIPENELYHTVSEQPCNSEWGQ